MQLELKYFIISSPAFAQEGGHIQIICIDQSRKLMVASAAGVFVLTLVLKLRSAEDLVRSS